jgi:hypothetical protein
MIFCRTANPRHSADAAMSSPGIENRAEHSRTEQPLSIHRFKSGGALVRTILILFGCVVALAIGLGCLGGCFASSNNSAIEAILWGVFSLCGFITSARLGYESIRLHVRTPSLIAVYRTGLRWRRRGKETYVPWSEVTRVDRQVSTFVVAGRLRHHDAITISYTSGKTFCITPGIFSDYQVFADSVTLFFDQSRFQSGVPNALDKCPTKVMRCWHCGEAFKVRVKDPSEGVQCPRCKAALGVIGGS